ncbi:cytochrome P450 alkane hydroxylase-like protein [Aulographum hederae CBS 113979]|uniref:Cytochrome P450 alkane hydroxylase-like protein n=1 Tax=Aulographum hederae CBS 113979 TaxID=1176131 RepID=A0A6G1GY18_9PEZI|nr:cytochrome P450 alkane hydroxylase-like protein [Aulographum hederae CBS 113979]
MLQEILSHLSALNIFLFTVLAYAVHYVAWTINDERKIRALGSRAAIRKTYLPFGADMIYESVKAARRHESLQMLQKGMARWGNPNNPNTFEGWAGGERLVITIDPENIKALLATQFHDYGKGEMFNREWHDFLGDSIFTTDGEKWHDSRQLIRPQFIKDRLSDLDTFERHVQVLLPAISGEKEVDLLDLFFRYTLDAATDFLLGQSVESLLNPKSNFADAFGRAQHTQSIIAKTGRLNRFVPRRKFFEDIATINAFMEPYIERTLGLPPDEIEKKSKSEEGYTFLHALAAYTRDRQMLRDQIIAILLAGRDTTACTLSWCFYELSLQPKIVAKLRQEIKNVVGLTRAPTYEDLKNMKYLSWTINETLRLYPVVPFNVRPALKDTTLPHGGGPDGNQPVGIPKGTQVAYSTLGMQRRADLYPPESSGFPPVNDFVPERWDGWTPKTWTYIPFNGGPRICVGQQFALTEMAYTIVRILQKFDAVESRMNGVHPGMRTDIVLQPANGVKVVLREARDEKV